MFSYFSLKDHLNVFNFSAVSGKWLLRVLAISSLFTSKVSFCTTSFLFVMILSFSIRIILESPEYVYLNNRANTYPKKALSF